MNRKKIVCIGDSLTQGYSIDSSQRWSSILSHQLNAEVINSGISGDTTSGMLARFQDMAIKHKPNYIIITGGTNDILLNLPENIIISHILAMTRYAKYHGIIPVIGIPTPFFNLGGFIDASPFSAVSTLTQRIEFFQNTLKQFAVSDNQFIIDFSLNMTSDLFLSDGLHPNEKGHQQMALNAKLGLEASIK